MKNRLPLLAAIAAALLLSCSASNTKSPNAPIKADVVALSKVPDETKPPRFSLAVRSFPTLKSVETMEGPYIRLRYGGVMRVSEVEGSLMMDASFSGGEVPTLRYTLKNGVVIPRDYQSLVMLSAYYQFESILENLEAKVGLTPALLLAKQKRGRLEVLFEPRIEGKAEKSSTELIGKRNAAFVPGQGQFVLFERSATEKTPLAVNLQVLSHEFGHALFDYAFYDGKEDDELLENRAMAGLNEGFADFFSFLMVGSTDVLGGSLFGSSLVAERNFARVAFSRSNAESKCHGEFYCLGTLFANALYQTRAVVTLSDGEILNKNLLPAFSAARAALNLSGVTGETSEEETLLRFFEPFVSAMSSASSALAPPLCSNLASNFDLTFTSGVCAQ